jgi:DNA-binding winged helix-turn-helix (wHTH) protein
VQSSRPTVYRFADFELELPALELRRSGERVELQELPLRLLAHLVQRPGAVVERDALHRALWPTEGFLEFDNSLNAAMSRLRRALGDPAGEAGLVATVPRRGYRFVAPVEVSGGVPAFGGARRLRRRWLWVALAALLAGAVVAGRWAQVWSGNESRVAPEVSREVREHLLRARHFESRRSREGLEKAMAELQSASALAPELAEPYAGLSMIYALLGAYDYWRPLDAFPPARRMAARALELEPRSAQAHLARSMTDALYRWDWAAALAGADRAVALAPAGVDPLQWRGMLRSALGRHEAGLADLDAAVERAPLSVTLRSGRCWALFYARRFDAAVAECRAAVELEPRHLDAWDNLKWVLLGQGRAEEAADAFARAVELEGGDPEGIRKLYARGGWTALLEDSIETKLERDRRGYQSAYDLALDYSALGRADAAMAWLERSRGERETDLMQAAVDPRLDPLRQRPDFRAWLAELGHGPSR